jgi:hypothetical protein
MVCRHYMGLQALRAHKQKRGHLAARLHIHSRFWVLRRAVMTLALRLCGVTEPSLVKPYFRKQKISQKGMYGSCS